VALGYLAISSALVVIFARNMARPLRLLSVQALVAMLIVALCHAETNAWASPWTSRLERLGEGTLTRRFWHFWRHW
jgi:hypothetical protein